MAALLLALALPSAAAWAGAMRPSPVGAPAGRMRALSPPSPAAAARARPLSLSLGEPAEAVSVTIRPPVGSMGSTTLLAARSGGRVGGRVSGGGGGRMGGGRGAPVGGATNVYMAPPMMSPFGFSPFGFSPFGFSPFGFGFGFGLPAPLLLFALGGLALTSFRSSRGIEAADTAGTALCLQVACYCEDRQTSLAGKLQGIARTADADSYEGLQRLVSDTCLAMLRTSKDWLAARTVSSTASMFANDVDTTYNKLVVQERAKWEVEQDVLKRSAPGQPTYLVATVVVLLRSGAELPSITGASDLREAISQLAADVSVEDNLLAAEVLWTPEDTNDVMDRDDMFLNFPELVTI